MKKNQLELNEEESENRLEVNEEESVGGSMKKKVPPEALFCALVRKANDLRPDRTVSEKTKHDRRR